MTRSAPTRLTWPDHPILLPGRLVGLGPPSPAEPGWFDGAVVVEDGRIAWLGRADAVPAPWTDSPTPPDWPRSAMITPGLIDLHCHGAGGAEFGVAASDSAGDHGARVAAARAAAEWHHAQGSTGVVGSLVSNTAEELVAGCRALAELVAEGTLAGIHLEGPFLSVTRRGAQNPDVLSDSDPGLVSRLVAATAEAGAPHALVQMTLAPERDPGDRVLAGLVAAGVLPAIGHTDADARRVRLSLSRAAELCRAGDVRARRPLVTHLFNGMPPMHHRAPGPVSAALTAGARGQAILEVIADGTHLDAEAVAMVFAVASPANVALVTDAMSACGMPDGTYTLGGKEVRVAAGEARLTDNGSLAGSVAVLADCVRFAVQQAGVPFADAITAATATPATVLDGPDTTLGRLVVGAPADLLAWSDDLVVQAVLADRPVKGASVR